jgi:hypothetical protein
MWATLDNDSEDLNREKIRVEQRELDGVTLAYALHWDEYFQEWSLLRPIRSFRDDNYNPIKGNELLLGTCIEGIRVEFDTPGFKGIPIIAMANATGANAPRTNVARSGLETTPQRDRLLRNVYSIFCKHIENEIQELHQKRSFSLTWATQEARFLLQPFLTSSRETTATKALDVKLFEANLQKLPVLLIENEGHRSPISPADFCRSPYFWTSESALFRSAENIIREVPGNASLTDILKALHAGNFSLPDSSMLCGMVPLGFDKFVFEGKEVDCIRIFREQRRVDLRWVDKSVSPRWRDVSEITSHSKSTKISGLSHFVNRPRVYASQQLTIGQDGVEISGLVNEVAVQAFQNLYVLPGTQLANYLTNLLDTANKVRQEEEILAFLGLFNIFEVAIRYGPGESYTYSSIENTFRSVVREYRYDLNFAMLRDMIDVEELIRIINSIQVRCFDPSVWQRREYLEDEL